MLLTLTCNSLKYELKGNELFVLSLRRYIRIGLVLGFEAEIVGDRPQQHFRDFDPVGTLVGEKECFQIASPAHKRRWTLIHLLRQDLQ
jgi:hypothetical protein